jgi:cysteine desulfurase
MLYLDHNATSPLRSSALEAMLPWLRRGAANPGSQHRAGQAARGALEQARESLGASLGGWPRDWLFTSGATEACNIGLHGLVQPGGRALLVGATEHPAVLETARALGRAGAVVEELPVATDGRVGLDALKGALARHPGAVVALMLANNETGVLHPIAQVAPLLHAQGGLLFCDLSQAAGKLPVDLHGLGADVAVLSAPKFGGPQGSGALWKRKGLELKPSVFGGHQELGLRPGTEAVAQAVGLAAALAEAVAGMDQQIRVWEDATAILAAGLKRLYPLARLYGQAVPRVANTLCASLPGLDSDLLLIRLDQLGLQASAGAACAAGSREPSHVLAAMGEDAACLKAALRFSLGPGQGEAEAQAGVKILEQALEGFRAAGLLG